MRRAMERYDALAIEEKWQRVWAEERAFEVPTRAGVTFTNMVIVSLGGQGTINRVINNTGGPANSTTQTVYLTNYP